MKKFCCVLFFLSLLSISYSEAPPKIALCTACHGELGVSPNTQWPHLAGQHPKYFIKQMQDFKNGTRQAPTMAAVLNQINETEFSEYAQFYAKQAPNMSQRAKKFLKRGELLYRGGDFAKRVPACIICHGPKGLGNSEAGFPMIAGQPSAYIIHELLAFKEKTRRNDLSGVMQILSERMSPEDMEAVANYIQNLH